MKQSKICSRGSFIVPVVLEERGRKVRPRIALGLDSSGSRRRLAHKLAGQKHFTDYVLRTSCLRQSSMLTVASIFPRGPFIGGLS